MSWLSVLGKVGSWLGRGLSVLPLIFDSVALVEKFSAGKLKGKEKQDAAVDLIQMLLAVAEGGAGRDLLNDGELQDATRKVIDAVVALQNIIAKKKG